MQVKSELSEPINKTRRRRWVRRRNRGKEKNKTYKRIRNWRKMDSVGMNTPLLLSLFGIQLCTQEYSTKIPVFRITFHLQPSPFLKYDLNSMKSELTIINCNKTKPPFQLSSHLSKYFLTRFSLESLQLYLVCLEQYRW